MNEMLGSECTSGCESGWTVYLEQSTYNSSYYTRANNEEQRKVPVYDEEDESMVSDASSGPPVGGSSMFSRIDDHSALERENRGRSKKKNRAKQSKRGQEHHASSLLDDTASSPIFNYSQNNYTAMNHQASMENSTLEYSQGFSATHFEGDLIKSMSLCLSTSLLWLQLKCNSKTSGLEENGVVDMSFIKSSRSEDIVGIILETREGDDKQKELDLKEIFVLCHSLVPLFFFC